MAFIGEHIVKVDAKGRLLFPSAFRKQMIGNAKEEFVINRGFEKCLVLYPKDVWMEISKKINALNAFVKENRQFVRQFNNGATLIALDSVGRLLLPKALLTYAGIKGSMCLAANGNKIEIWSKDAYNKLMAINADEFAELAERVMGDKALNTEGDFNDES